MTNPFYTEMDWLVQAKKLKVYGDDFCYTGWGAMNKHGSSEVILHDATNTETGESVGSVYLRDVTRIESIEPRKTIEYRSLEDLTPHPEYNIEFEPRNEQITRCYRNQSTGSYPVIRSDGTIINGHKRVAAAIAAGLEKHPCEVIEVTDEQAKELFELAHSDDISEDTTEKPHANTNQSATPRLQTAHTNHHQEVTHKDHISNNAPPYRNSRSRHSY